MNASFFNELLSSIAERGRLLLEWRNAPAGSGDLAEDCERLLSGRGEASSVAIAREILSQYARSPDDDKTAFFRLLTERFAVDLQALERAFEAYRREPSPKRFKQLFLTCEPPRQELFRRLNRAPGGTAALVALRRDLLTRLPEHPELAAVDFDLAHLFGSWFNRGFLVLRRIDWSTPANILEKIIRYEAVHEIRDWDELRRRLQPADRRCFAFFHPTLPDEPLIFVEVALTERIPGSIHAILDDRRPVLDAAQAGTAVFYSISNCQAGLRGISFGSFLIKQVVEDLAREIPTLKTFVTLSPVPGFRSWLERRRAEPGSALLSAEERRRLALLDQPDWHRDPRQAEPLRELVLALAGHYLLHARRRDGRPLDPVAGFHLGNGARLERIHWLADRSDKGLRQAAGLMVNYLYDLDHIEANHESFANQGIVVASRAVQRLARPLPKTRSSKSSVPMNQNLFVLIRSRLPADRDAPFIVTGDDRRYRYADLLRQSARLANTLVALGVQPGDRVAVQVDKSPETVMLYLASLRAGAVYLPLNTAYTPDEVGYFLRDAEPALFVCRPDSREQAETLARDCGVAQVATLGTEADGSLMEQARDADDEFTDVAREPDDLAAILYTSGTTGRSKGAMLTHGNLASNAQVLVDTWHFTADDRLLHALPIFHTHGLFVACNTVLLSGASMIFLPRFDADEIIRLLPQATAMMGVPTFYTRLLARNDFTRERVQHMRLFVSGSAPLAAETHRAFAERTGHAILERYGMTETNMITSNPYDGERIAGTVGFPLPGVELRIANLDSGALLAPGETGMIEVRGPNVFKGYWRMPEKTRSEFRDDGFFITGDVGLIDERGYVHIVGREKDLIISGGYNVYPKEIEILIDERPEVVESAVIGLPHPDFGEGVTAVVVPRSGAEHDTQAIVASLEGHLARYKIPKKVFFVDELPRNAMGKVQKNQLRERFKDVYLSQGGST